LGTRIDLGDVRSGHQDGKDSEFEKF